VRLRKQIILLFFEPEANYTPGAHLERSEKHTSNCIFVGRPLQGYIVFSSSQKQKRIERAIAVQDLF
jgi:hypothetical protein